MLHSLFKAGMLPKRTQNSGGIVVLPLSRVRRRPESASVLKSWAGRKHSVVTRHASRVCRTLACYQKSGQAGIVRFSVKKKQNRCNDGSFVGFLCNKGYRKNIANTCSLIWEAGAGELQPFIQMAAIVRVFLWIWRNNETAMCSGG